MENSEILYPAKISLVSGGNISELHYKKNVLKEFMTTKTALQRILQNEEKNKNLYETMW